MRLQFMFTSIITSILVIVARYKLYGFINDCIEMVSKDLTLKS